MKKHDMHVSKDIIENCLLNVTDFIIKEYSNDIIKKIRKKFPKRDFTHDDISKIIRNIVGSDEIIDMFEEELVYKYKNNMFDAYQYLCDIGYRQDELELESSKHNIIPLAVSMTMLEAENCRNIYDERGALKYILNMIEEHTLGYF